VPGVVEELRGPDEGPELGGEVLEAGQVVKEAAESVEEGLDHEQTDLKVGNRVEVAIENGAQVENQVSYLRRAEGLEVRAWIKYQAYCITEGRVNCYQTPHCRVQQLVTLSSDGSPGSAAAGLHPPLPPLPNNGGPLHSEMTPEYRPVRRGSSSGEQDGHFFLWHIMYSLSDQTTGRNSSHSTTVIRSSRKIRRFSNVTLAEVQLLGTGGGLNGFIREETFFL